MKNDKDMYRLHRFSPEQLVKVSRDVMEYAEAIGGLPQSHSEVFLKRGWLTPYLLAYDSMLWGRWDYWTDILSKGTIEGSGHIPQIDWTSTEDAAAQEAMKMLQRGMNHHEATIDHFADWLLWGLARTEEKPRVSAALNEHFYKMFDLFLVLDRPTDYLSTILCDQTGKRYKSALGYFPTPFNVTRMMVQMLHGGSDPEKLKRQTVSDPCVGCGAMLLPASNHFLRGYGTDISGIAVKLCTIQLTWYAPWFALPGKVKGFDEESSLIPLVLAEARRGITPGQLQFAF